MASIDKRMMIKTLKQFLQPYVGVTATNFDVSGQYEWVAIIRMLFKDFCQLFIYTCK